MGKGYAEGSAVEERLAALERGDDLHLQLDAGRTAVYGSTDDDPESHFLGWLDEVDPDELFASGARVGHSHRAPDRSLAERRALERGHGAWVDRGDEVDADAVRPCAELRRRQRDRRGRAAAV